MKILHTKFPNTKLLGLMTVTALLGTVLATASVAQPRGRGGFENPPPRAEVRGPRAQERGPQAQQRGGLRARGPAGQSERAVMRLDTDGDSRVSEAEFVDARLQQVDKQFERRDTDGDGLISTEEHEAPRALPGRGDRTERPGRARPEAPAIDRDAVAACVREAVPGFEPRDDATPEDNFAEADANGDGNLSLAEASAAVEARAKAGFARLDDNGDGFVTEDEVKAQRDAGQDVRRALRECVRAEIQD